MNPSAARITRRAVLRGAGVTLALPWLESFAERAGAAEGAAFPKRFGVVHLGCGVNELHWGAEGAGAEMKLSRSLAPLEPLKHKINVIHGLFNKNNVGRGIHPPQTGSLLTGDVIRHRRRPERDHLIIIPQFVDPFDLFNLVRVNRSHVHGDLVPAMSYALGNRQAFRIPERPPREKTLGFHLRLAGDAVLCSTEMRLRPGDHLAFKLNERS